MNFSEAFQKTVFDWEGGDRLHNVPGDPGGLTKYGISQRAYPALRIASLTESAAKDIYHGDYWRPLRVGELPDALRWDVFDFGVNAGLRRSAVALQRAINHCRGARGYPEIATDGQIGPRTISAAQGLPALRLLRVFRAVRTQHYMILADRGMEKFLEGWLDRVDGTAGNA